MEENNRKGPGVFYAVVGVATLVVAIIGATFAFFSASNVDPNTDTVQGQTATAASVTLSVTQVFPDAESGLSAKLGRIVPLKATDMGTALTNKCVDKNGYVACQVYKVVVANGSADPVYVRPKAKLAAGDLTDLKWQVLTGTSEKDFAVTGLAVTDHTDYTPLTDLNGGKGVSVDNTTAEAGRTFYFVVWLDETDVDQTEAQAGKTFGGTVTVDLVDNTGATFTGKLTASFGA